MFRRVEPLFSMLGAVCGRCEVFNAPGIVVCAACGAGLDGALWAGRGGPSPAPEKAARAPGAQAPAAPPRSLTVMGKVPTPVPAAPASASARSEPVASRTPGPAPSAPLRPPGPPPALDGRTPGPLGGPRGSEEALEGRYVWTPGPDAASRRIDVVPRPIAPAKDRTPGPDAWRPSTPSAAVDKAADHCPRCGRPHPAQGRFCAGCGLKLGAEEERRPTASITPGSAKLVLLRGLGASGSTFPLKDDETQAGMSVGALRFPSDDTLGPLAATFVYRGGRLLVRDEGGPSGVFIRLTAPAVLAQDDWFSIGDKLLRFLGRVPMPQAQSSFPRLLGSARPGAGPLLRLQIVHLGGIGGRVHALPAPLRIGRTTGELIFGDDPFISSRHCELDLDPAGAMLRDLGSSNGTFIRLPPGGEHELRPGDTLRLGRNILRLE